MKKQISLSTQEIELIVDALKTIREDASDDMMHFKTVEADLYCDCENQKTALQQYLIDSADCAAEKVCACDTLLAKLLTT